MSLVHHCDRKYVIMKEFIVTVQDLNLKSKHTFGCDDCIHTQRSTGRNQELQSD
jgi:hypothetical protein